MFKNISRPKTLETLYLHIQAEGWETLCLQVQRWETDSNKFYRRETFAVSAGTCIPVKMKKKCRPQCLYMLKLVVISGIFTIQSLTLQITKKCGGKVNTEGEDGGLSHKIWR